jgi:hypothetical protein
VSYRRPDPPAQPPQRQKGFYEAMITDWRCTALMSGMTDQEIILCAAQFCGLSVANSNLTAEGQAQTLDIAERAMRTAHFSRVEVKAGRAVPRVPPTPPGGHSA